jgi:NAD+ synthase (glutamine-hydrolysing)
VFDGGSLSVDAECELLYRARQFAPERFIVDVPVAAPRPPHRRPATVHARVAPPRTPAPPPAMPQEMDDLDQVWHALVMGTRDFVKHAGFAGAVVALSGGIDSALTTAVAVAALGPDAVIALAMPAGDTRGGETEAAQAVGAALGIEVRVVPVGGLTAAGDILFGSTGGTPGRLSADDLDARARGAVLMAVAEELNHIALATGNKTELSIGAGVLFGDMAGGFSPLRDCPKTLVYQLAGSCGRRGLSLPVATLESPPTIMGRADDLPDYPTLDAIVERYVELGEGAERIIAAGFDPREVHGVLQLIDDAEFKRRQIAPGVKITARAFASDRRMPIANRWRPYAGDEPNLSGAREPRTR